ncbi:hypothetical protein PEP31012_04177 [Pandoraea eparura]|uniref:Uncharacterized protein n=1 Tax=Pandoraea eparura TaxID=2508291 RepID=A0A5E4XWK1_9BURK|nr:hypothetical protein PEP31012_04177 [Pandoraea eparura]
MERRTMKRVLMVASSALLVVATSALAQPNDGDWGASGVTAQG